MSFLGLRDNVFLVEGAHNHAIYDFNSCRLYSINHFTLSFIRHCISAEIIENSITQDDNACLSFLLSNSLLEPSNEIKPENKIESHFSGGNKSFNYAWIELTNLCNLRCKHCYSSQDLTRLGSMNLNSFSRVINELLSVGVKNIQLIGGEPLILQKKLKEMIYMVVDAFKRVSIYTNATLIDSDWARFFSNQKIYVNTTVYSYSANEHDKVTKRPGSHKKTNKAIQYLKNFGANYSVSCVRMNGVQPGNKQTDLYNLDIRRDVVRNCGRADFKLLNRELLREKIITKKRFSRPLKPKISSLLASGHNCFSQKIYITHDLRVYPCPMERGIEYGSLEDNKLNQIMEKMSPINKNAIKVCKDCEYRYACMDCRPDRLENDLLAKPWYCSYDPYKSTWQPVDDFIHSFKRYYST